MARLLVLLPWNDCIVVQAALKPSPFSRRVFDHAARFPEDEQ
jgi:hypothetical protein